VNKKVKKENFLIKINKQQCVQIWIVFSDGAVRLAGADDLQVRSQQSGDPGKDPEFI
jgi:hypothetical protein